MRRGKQVKLGGVPRSAWPDNLTMAVIALSTVAYLAALPYPLGPLDEGLYLFEAKRILHGDVFYRDIFDIATPGSYYLMALMFALFGTTMTMARTAAALIHGLTAALVYAGGRRLGVDRPLSLAAAASQLAVCQAAWPYASPHWAGTLITTLLLVVLIGRPTLQGWRWYLLPGTLLGALALVQHQKALIIAFGVAAVLAADFVIDLRFGRARGRLGDRGLLDVVRRHVVTDRFRLFRRWGGAAAGDGQGGRETQNPGVRSPHGEGQHNEKAAAGRPSPK